MKHLIRVENHLCGFHRNSSTIAGYRAGLSSVVLLRYIENIKISIRYQYIISYRIASGNIEIFDISVSNF